MIDSNTIDEKNYMNYNVARAWAIMLFLNDDLRKCLTFLELCGTEWLATDSNSWWQFMWDISFVIFSSSVSFFPSLIQVYKWVNLLSCKRVRSNLRSQLQLKTTQITLKPSGYVKFTKTKDFTVETEMKQIEIKAKTLYYSLRNVTKFWASSNYIFKRG